MKLFDFEMRWVAAAFEAIFPEPNAHSNVRGLPLGIAQMNPGAFLADTIRSSAFEQAMGLRITVWIVALAPLWFLRRPRTIASLDTSDRQRVLERLLASPVYAVRQLVMAFKAMASLLYSQSREARLAMTTPTTAVSLCESGLVQVRNAKKSNKNKKAADAAKAGASNESAA